MFLRRLSSGICAILFVCLCATTSASLDLRPTVSPWLEDGTNTFLRVQRNVAIGTALPVDALSVTTAPIASATRALVNLSNTALSGGSAAGTYLGANPAACTGDFFNFQLANAARATLTCAGALTVVSSTNNLSIFAATTSAQLLGVISDETGSGALVFATSPTLITPILGVATATTINGLTITTSTGTLTIANGKTLTVSNTLTFTGTDSSSVALGAGGTVGYLGTAQTWSANNTFSSTITIASTGYFLGNTTSGYRFNNAADTVNLLIITNTGVTTMFGLEGTGSATGKTIVCADAGGVIYRSSSGDTCLN